MLTLIIAGLWLITFVYSLRLLARAATVVHVPPARLVADVVVLLGKFTLGFFATLFVARLIVSIF